MQMTIDIPWDAVGVLVGLVALYGTYHTARRSGTFLRPPLRLWIGLPNSSRWRRPLLAVVVGIPRTHLPADEFVFELPILLDAGSVPVRNARIQVFYGRGRDGSASPAFEAHYAGNPGSGVSRRTVHHPGGTQVEYSIATTLSNQTNILTEPLVYRSREIHPCPKSAKDVHFEEVTVSVRAENHPGLDISFLLAAVDADSPTEINAAASHFAAAACIHRRLSVITFNRRGVALVPPPRILWSHRLLFIQPNFQRAAMHGGKPVALCLGKDNHSSAWLANVLPLYHSTSVPKSA